MNKTFLKAMEFFALRAFLIVISFQLLTLFVLVFGSDNIANLHGKIIGIPDEKMSQFEYDWKLQMFFFVGFLKVLAIVFLEFLGRSFDFQKNSRMTIVLKIKSHDFESLTLNFEPLWLRSNCPIFISS